jgi:hypothetical protein
MILRSFSTPKKCGGTQKRVLINDPRYDSIKIYIKNIGLMSRSNITNRVVDVASVVTHLLTECVIPSLLESDTNISKNYLVSAVLIVAESLE